MCSPDSAWPPDNAVQATTDYSRCPCGGQCGGVSTVAFACRGGSAKYGLLVFVYQPCTDLYFFPATKISYHWSPPQSTSSHGKLLAVLKKKKKQFIPNVHVMDKSTGLFYSIEDGEKNREVLHRNAYTNKLLLVQSSVFLKATTVNLDFDPATNLHWDSRGGIGRCYHWNATCICFMPAQQNTIYEQSHIAPDIKLMESDKHSGLYFDPRTGLKYDAGSDLHFDSEQKPYHWSSCDSCYLLVEEPPNISVLLEEDNSDTKQDNDTSEQSYCGTVMDLVIQDSSKPTPDRRVSIGNKKASSVVTIGRGPDNTVVLKGDVEVSKKHAKITCESLFWEHYFWIQDVGSRNGTIVNGKRLSASLQPSSERNTRLFPGDCIQIGKFSIRMENPRIKQNKSDAQPNQTPEEATHSLGGTKVTSEEWVTLMKRKIKQLTSEELKQTAERKSQYEDLAAKRRKLHPELKYPQQMVLREEEDQQQQDIVPPVTTHRARAHIYAEKPKEEQPAQPIHSDNRGFQMLAGMGWKEGKGLGVSENGQVTPIIPQVLENKRGLGYKT